MFDIIIIGKGPAGITAGIYAKRAGYNCLIIGQDRSQLLETNLIENYYGLSKPISGKALYENGLQQAKDLEIDLLDEEVLNINIERNFVVTTNTKTYESKAIILATGINKNKLDIPGAEEFRGKGVSTCATCDGYFFKNKSVAVIGSGEYAFNEVIELSKIVDKVTMLTNGHLVRAEKPALNVEFNSEKIKEINGTEKVEKVTFENGNFINVSGVFLALGIASSLDLAEKLGIITKNKAIVTNENMETNIPGVFAAGDCTGGLWQICKATYEGAKAALSAINYLKTK